MPDQKAVKKEQRKLARIFAGIDANQLVVVEGLIERAAFLRVSLAELEIEIANEGYTEEYQNGENQHGVKQSVAVNTYNAMLKNYMAIIDKLTKLTPAAVEKSKLAEFLRPGTQ